MEQQVYRFSQTLAAVDFSGKSILDIGCGFGDYLHFIQNKNTASYWGWDLNSNFVQEARIIFGEFGKFDVVDVSVEDNIKVYQGGVDIAVMLGLLNYNLNSEDDNYAYSQQLICNAFSLVKEVLIVDCLSAYRTPDYPVEDFVFYHEPSRMLDFALSLSSNAVLKHDYAPIPQKEFMLFIYK
ncbi:class I SAM-dependent methyltransferase [Nostoc sp. C117]|uniref:class I SAM-dependent methyltransferase n=1 Tax=Nostoc sp. C117 TaxID=3349875 RepID=UPI00370CFF6B